VNELRKVAEDALVSARVYRTMLEAPEGVWVPYDAKTVARDLMLPWFEKLATLAAQQSGARLEPPAITRAEREAGVNFLAHDMVNGDLTLSFVVADYENQFRFVISHEKDKRFLACTLNQSEMKRLRALLDYCA
jgi:hypothetical protein